MAKKGMKHYYPKHKKNDETPVPEICGKAKSGKEKARPMIAGTAAPAGSVYHILPPTKDPLAAFPAMDNDLAAENLTNSFDMTAADQQDFEHPQRQ